MNIEHQYDLDRTTIGLLIHVLDDKEVKLTKTIRNYLQKDLAGLCDRHQRYIGNGKTRPVPTLLVAYQSLITEPTPPRRKEIAESLRALIGASY